MISGNVLYSLIYSFDLAVERGFRVFLFCDELLYVPGQKPIFDNKMLCFFTSMLIYFPACSLSNKLFCALLDFHLVYLSMFAVANFTNFCGSFFHSIVLNKHFSFQGFSLT